MNIFIWIMVTFAVALIGGGLGAKTHLPAGAMLGAIIATALWNILSGQAVLPAATRPILQILGGVLLGHSISKDKLMVINRIGGAVIVLISGLLLLNIAMGGAIHAICGMDLKTAILATAPGGVSDMAIIAQDFGADSTKVSILQLFRMFGIYSIYPPMLKKIAGSTNRERKAGRDSITQIANQRIITWKEIRVNTLLTIICGLAGGLCLRQMGIPAGALIGSVVACGGFNILTARGRISNKIKFPVQACVGAMIGIQMNYATLLSLKELAVPIVIMTGGLLLYTFFFAFCMTKVSNLDYLTCLLALTPGGIQETSMLTEDVGGDTSIVIVMHTIRLVVVICVFPLIFQLLI